jgi:hypothetical protein
MLKAINWDGWGISEPFWATLIIVVALGLTITMIGLRKDIAFSLVVVWALVGIISKQSGYEEIVLTAEVAIAVILVAAVAVVLVPRFKR